MRINWREFMDLNIRALNDDRNNRVSNIRYSDHLTNKEKDLAIENFDISYHKKLKDIVIENANKLMIDEDNIEFDF